ncbi:MAG TPA: SDR family oxidoreductase [Candidatus Saccharimonadales bacterium]|nr:SDR family oxidoreductase [Candidatus Saccharimonadales bacterium]
MKILLTGGAGYIGSVLTFDLLQKGHSITVLDRLMFGGESLVPFVEHPKFSLIVGDIRDKTLVNKSLKNIDCVIHLAALVGEPACRENPRTTRQINFEATKQLALLAKREGVRKFIFSSTCSNYGISDVSQEATEETPLNPLSLYSETKIAAEKFILSQKSGKFSPTVLRLATIFGLSPRMRFNLMVNEMARDAVFGKEYSIRNENAWRPFLHVKDAADAIAQILISKKKSGDIFNIVSQNVQKKDLVKLLKKVNRKVQVTIDEGGKDDKRDYRVSAQKFKKTFHWKPKFSVENGFMEIYEAVNSGVFVDTQEFRWNGWFDKSVFEEKFKL